MSSVSPKYIIALVLVIVFVVFIKAAIPIENSVHKIIGPLQL